MHFLGNFNNIFFHLHCQIAWQALYKQICKYFLNFKFSLLLISETNKHICNIISSYYAIPISPNGIKQKQRRKISQFLIILRLIMSFWIKGFMLFIEWCFSFPFVHSLVIFKVFLFSSYYLKFYISTYITVFISRREDWHQGPNTTHVVGFITHFM